LNRFQSFVFGVLLGLLGVALVAEMAAVVKVLSR
jgi:tetrahydromethanopterin S-methyltransferase subunit B